MRGVGINEVPGMSNVVNLGLSKPEAGAKRAVRSRIGLTRRQLSENLVGYLFISPWLVGFFVFTLIPILASLYLAFTTYDTMSPPVWSGTENFVRMVTKDPRYWASVKATLYYVLTAIPLRLIFALAVAMLLNSDRKGVGVYRAMFYAPSIVGGSVAVAVMWRQVFGQEGLVNFVLALVGVPPTIWLGNPATAIWTLIILAAWQFGSPMLIFLAGLRQIPSPLYEAAAIDGAGAASKFFKITLPMLSPVIFFNLVLQMINGFMAFTQALIVTGGGRPLDTTLLYALYIYQRAFETLQMGYGAAMAWVLLVVIALVTALIFKTSSAWVFYESK
jgi:pectin-derived oligosaccharide transport system permease protein